MGHAVNNRPIIAVTCLSFEAQVAAGPGIDVLCGTAQRYIDKLESAVDAGGSGIISIGIAGGLAPGLAPGRLGDRLGRGRRRRAHPDRQPVVATAAPGASERGLCRYFRGRRSGRGAGRQARPARIRRHRRGRHGIPHRGQDRGPARRAVRGLPRHHRSGGADAAAGRPGRHARRRPAGRVRRDPLALPAAAPGVRADARGRRRPRRPHRAVPRPPPARRQSELPRRHAELQLNPSV